MKSYFATAMNKSNSFSLEGDSMLQTIIVAAITSLLATLGALLLAKQRMEREFRLQFQAETIIRKLLQHPQWALRSFDTIKHHVGGFDDDELRRTLVQAGALRFYAQDTEMWGLFERTQQALDGVSGYEKHLRPDA
jgi:hypothetical protein